MTNPKVETYDVRGQVCPSTLLLALREVNRLSSELRSGQVEVEILTDNRNATITIPNAVKSLGLETAVAQIDQGYLLRIGLRKGLTPDDK